MASANSAGVADAIRDTLDLFLADHPGLLDVDVELAEPPPERMTFEHPRFELTIGGKPFEVEVREAAHG